MYISPITIFIHHSITSIPNHILYTFNSIQFTHNLIVTTMDAYIEPHNQSPALSPAESASTSTSTSDCSGGAGNPESEVMLASKNPKKRAGRKKFKETRHPVYRGVRRRNSKKWVCEVRQPNKKSRVWLGTYPTAEMAARAHDVAVLALRGPSACLNFADSVWRLRLPESCNVKDIQKAAAEAAEAFREIENDEMNVVEVNELQEDVVYIDEEEVFGLPEFFAGMAEGLMVPPPRLVGYDNFMDMDNVEFCVDLSLWSY